MHQLASIGSKIFVQGGADYDRERFYNWNDREGAAEGMRVVQIRAESAEGSGVTQAAQLALAPQAAGVIHSDFERGFIKAEVVAFDDFKAIATKPSMAEVKEAGKYRQEGKAYVVKDADIIQFMFSSS